MKEILPLIRIISNRKISDKYIVKANKSHSKQDKLYFAIKSGKISTDVEAFVFLYGGKGNYHSFTRLKNRLKDKLYNVLLTLDGSKQKYSDLKKAYYKIMKNFVIGHLIFREGEQQLAAAIFEETIQQALKYEATEYVKLMSYKLLTIFSHVIQNEKKHNKYLKIFLENSEIESNELKANLYYHELSRMYYNKDVKKKDFVAKLAEYGEELKEKQGLINTYIYNQKTYSINSTRYIYEKKYDKAIQNADTALRFFEDKPYYTFANKYVFNSDKINAYILKREHEKAERLILETIDLMPQKSFNYFRLFSYHFINYSVCGNYQSLYEVVKQVIENKIIKKFKNQYELWRIKEAYVYFLLEAGKIKLTEEQQKGYKPFKLGKFLNDIPHYSKEKRGMNISILVVQMMFFIVRKKYNNAIDRVDALKQYSFRYLRKDDTFRSNCFIKMLIKIPLADFHPVRTELYTGDLYKNLLVHEMDIQGITNEVEVVPFHDLWSIILEVLELNRKK